jgi:exopolysaccharide biosynthesis polyprenyl glycosylphosphotransferase
MKTLRERFLLVLADIIALNLALFVAYWIRFRSGVALAEVDLSPASYLIPAMWITLYWLVIFTFNGLYKATWDISRVDQSLSLFKAVTLGVLLLAVATLDLSDPFPRSRLVIFGYWLALLLLLNSFRLVIRGVERNFRIKGLARRRAIIVGAAERGEVLLREISEYPALGYEIVGFVDDDPKKAEKEILGKRVLGSTGELARLIRERDVEEVLIAISTTSHQAILRIMGLCVGTRVAFRIVPDLYDIVSGHKTHQVYGFPLVRLFPEPMDMGQRFLKRAFDIIFSLGVLLLFLPLWLLVALAIKMASRGPVLFKQRRIGKRAKEFTLYKFRSMIEDAEKDTGPVWAEKDDKRVTKIGWILRRTRLDEIPQLLNVLRGEMSLVGPRPERPYFVGQLMQEIPLYSRRLNVKPGITGWAQTKHTYDASFDDVREKVKYDLYYIENMSLTLDLKILARTILVTLTGSGAH